jgi:hypothetical protein
MDLIRAADLRSRSMGYAQDARPRRNGAYEAVRSAIDQLDPEDIAELLESLLEERGENWGEDRRRAADSRRRTARDDPPPFPGRPETGGTMTGGRADNLVSSAGRGDWQDRGGSGEAEDRRRGRGRAHDSNALITDRGFNERFPETSRISMVS